MSDDDLSFIPPDQWRELLQAEGDIVIEEVFGDEETLTTEICMPISSARYYLQAYEETRQGSTEHIMPLAAVLACLAASLREALEEEDEI